MKRKPSLKFLRNKLDDAFSKFIRKRDADENGMGVCITCGKWAKLQCGHFIKRQHLATRWDERNAHGQCVRCNLWLHGNESMYAFAMIRDYGLPKIAELIDRKYTTVKFTRSDLENMIERYS